MSIAMSFSWRLFQCLVVCVSWCHLDVLAVATTLVFDGSQFLTVSLPGSRTEVEDISLRFKTTQANGLLLATSSMAAGSRIGIRMDLSRARVNLSVDLGSGTKVGSHCYNILQFILLVSPK